MPRIATTTTTTSIRTRRGTAFFNIPSVILTLLPAKRFSYGIKADGNLTYNDRQEGANVPPLQSRRQLWALLAVGIRAAPGDGLRSELGPKYYLDLDTQRDLNRTGNGVYTKGTVSWDSLKSGSIRRLRRL